VLIEFLKTLDSRPVLGPSEVILTTYMPRYSLGLLLSSVSCRNRDGGCMAGRSVLPRSLIGEIVHKIFILVFNCKDKLNLVSTFILEDSMKHLERMELSSLSTEFRIQFIGHTFMYYSSYISNQTSLMIAENQGLPPVGSNATGILGRRKSWSEASSIY
jgi:hypothetical protein